NTQPGIALQQGLQIQVRLVTDQLQFDAVALADGFVSAERQHPKVVLKAGQVQGEVASLAGENIRRSLFSNGVAVTANYGPGIIPYRVTARCERVGINGPSRLLCPA